METLGLIFIGISIGLFVAAAITYPLAYSEGHKAGRQVSFQEELGKARRTYEQQRELYEKFSKKGVQPGKSAHNQGPAADHYDRLDKDL